LIQGDYKKVLERVEKNKEEYLLIVTGHQGEPGSVLDRLARGEHNFDLTNTTIIFANNVIPHPINEANRKILEERLKEKSGNNKGYTCIWSRQKARII